MIKSCQECGKCCIETEMLLSVNDIKRIIKFYDAKINQDDFCFLNKSGQFQIKNIKESCYFFDSESIRCKIYNIRPKGCEFYPLVYNIEIGGCEFDLNCPNPEIIYKKIDYIDSTCEMIQNFIKEELNIGI
jgi:Fe-S-cluster containining protein